METVKLFSEQFSDEVEYICEEKENGNKNYKIKGIRVNEFAGQDVFVKLTLAGTAVTATNGTYVKASSSLIIHPEEKPHNGPGNILLDGTDSSSSNAGDSITAESGVDSTGKTVLQYNRAEDNFTLSVKNETNGSDGGVHVEEVTFIHNA